MDNRAPITDRDTIGSGLSVLQLRRRIDDLTRLISDMVWETDADLRLRSLSLRVVDILGFHPQVYIGKLLSEFGHFLSPAGDQISIDLHAPFRDVMFMVKNHANEDRILLVSGLPVFDETSGRFLGVRGTARDITANRLVAEALRQSEERLKRAIEASNDAFWEWNVPGEKAYFSGVWARLLGLAFRNSMIDIADWNQAIHPEDRKRTTHALTERLLYDVSFELPEYRVQTADGRWIWILTRAQVVARDADGKAERVVGTHRDITGRMDAAEKLRMAKEEADLANRAKTEFLANMSHELRTPLNSIIGFSDILANETFGPIGRPEYQEYANDINESGRHLLNLISDILDVSRIEANGLQLVETACDLSRLVGSCLRLVRERAGKAGIEIKKDLLADPPALYADERRVRQIVLNLLSNALKFTPRGGTVTVCVRRNDDEELVISVADTGIGIATEDLEAVMSPFRQVDGSLARRYEGAGLGLPLSKRLAELHGGTVFLESEPGKGTVASAVFPRHRILDPIGR